MQSKTLPSFWRLYSTLDSDIKQRAIKAYGLWVANHFHPSLQFKCINSEENVWSVRITHRYCALGIVESNTITWFWIGSHDEYERFFG